MQFKGGCLKVDNFSEAFRVMMFKNDLLFEKYLAKLSRLKDEQILLAPI